MIRLLVVDDYRALCQAFARELNRHPDMEVVATALDGEGAVEVARETRPDVVVLDIELPDTSGLDVAPRIQKLQPPPRILFLSGYADPRFVRRALNLGAHGYVLKTAALETLQEAVLCVHGGKRYFSPKIRRIAASMGLRGFRPRKVDPSLTSREREVLALMSAGSSLAETATALGIKRITVRNHWDRVVRKLGLRAQPGGMMISR